MEFNTEFWQQRVDMKNKRFCPNCKEISDCKQEKTGNGLFKYSLYCKHCNKGYLTVTFIGVLDKIRFEANHEVKLSVLKKPTEVRSDIIIEVQRKLFE